MKLYYINLIKTKLAKSKTLISNFFSLSFIQAANFLLPLIIMPHLVENLGLDLFGIVSTSQAVIQFFIIFTDYGFNLSATKAISVNRGERDKVSSLFNSVLQTKLILCALSVILLVSVSFLVPGFRSHSDLYLFGTTMVIGQALLPVWYFQGVEKMKFLTFVHLISKLLFTLLIFVLIQKRSDYIYVNLLMGIGTLTGSVLSIVLAITKFKISLRFTSRTEIREQLKEGFSVFTSNFFNTIYIRSNIIILSFFAIPEVLGAYSIAERVFEAMKRLIDVMFTTVYPHACKLASESADALKRFYTRFGYSQGIIFICLGILIFSFAENIVLLVAKEVVPMSVKFLKLLSFVPVIISLNVAAYQVALILRFSRVYAGVLIAASIINIVANLFLASAYQAYGTILAILITEVFVTFAVNYMVWRISGINFFTFSNLSLQNHGKN